MVNSDLTNPVWGNPPWPKKFGSLRDHQLVALDRIMDAYDRGIDIVLLDAPTGSGKTALGEATRRILRPENALYVAHTIGLQEQMLRDFPYARLLKGKSNYPTFDHPELFGKKLGLSAADCDYFRGGVCGDCDNLFATDSMLEDDKPHCSHCHPVFNCPYKRAKYDLMAKDCPIGVTNTAYFLTEANYVKGLSDRDFVIVDEADTLFNILLDQIEVRISAQRIKKYKIKPPKLKTVESSWGEWLTQEAIPKLKKELAEHSASFRGRKPTVPETREFKYLTSMLAKLYTIPKELESGNIVYDGYDSGEVAFKPIHADRHAPEMVWKHANKWLLMSASFIDPNGDMIRLGANRAELSWEVVTVPSTFDIKRRPIHVKPVADMSYKNKEQAWPLMGKGIADILNLHPDERILIHTVSYEFMNYILDNLNVDRPMLYYKTAKERDYTLKEFRNTDAGVLLAPSMDRGISLDDDDCRVIIIPKVPNLNIGDKVVKKRLYAKGGQLWYRVETLRTLVQMSGRGMRHSEDYCTTWLLDAQFLKIFKESENLLPNWWKDSLDWSGGVAVSVESG